MRFDKIAGSNFEQPKAGPEGARHREVPSNPLAPDMNFFMSSMKARHLKQTQRLHQEIGVGNILMNLTQTHLQAIDKLVQFILF